ncbi:nitroreductase family deazaflavin-dependent oxidoreductase [Streptomyces yangpuensis]|uniref:nitroreductase family deazaflavin-dependent oxidoreductase n=1 Tax=Streptomyces yangpuensis TaxID=1648182 RepID=UPI00371D8A3D
MQRFMHRKTRRCDCYLPLQNGCCARNPEVVVNSSAPRWPGPPVGWRRLLARLPLVLYRVGLGPVLGKRFLVLHHEGCYSGRRRTVCLEVVDHDPLYGTWTVASGFGDRSQWYRNLRHVPQVVIQVGRQRHAVTAYFLSPEESAEAMVQYAASHPRAVRMVCGLLSPDLGRGTQGDLRQVGRRIPFVRLDEVPPRRWR